LADFLQEIDNEATLQFSLKRPLHIESASGPDVAFFEVGVTGGDRTLASPIELATGTNDSLTQVGMILGTLAYMSPEQWGIGIEIDHLTDIWACAILLHRMICGRHPLHPLDGNQLVVTAMLELPMPSMAEAAPSDVPRELIQIVDRCLLKIKEQRWQIRRSPSSVNRCRGSNGQRRISRSSGLIMMRLDGDSGVTNAFGSEFGLKCNKNPWPARVSPSLFAQLLQFFRAPFSIPPSHRLTTFFRCGILFGRGGNRDHGRSMSRGRYRRPQRWRW